jgi:hypothetical protein
MRARSASFTHFARRRLLSVAVTLILLLVLSVTTRAQVTLGTASVSGCDGSAATKCTPRVMSLVQLLATPERYDGKRVRVVGFVHLEFESDAVYLHREDFERALRSNSMAVGFRPDVYKRGATFNDRYVLLEGIFRAGGAGNLQDALTDIWSADVWPAYATADQRMRGFKVLVGKPKVSTKPRP